MKVVRVPRVNLTEQRFALSTAINMPNLAATSAYCFHSCINKNTQHAYNTANYDFL